MVKRDHFPYFTLGMGIALTDVQYTKDDKLEFVTPQSLLDSQGDLDPQALQALTDNLKPNRGGACEISLARDEVLGSNDEANVFLLIKYSVGSV